MTKNTMHLSPNPSVLCFVIYGTWVSSSRLRLGHLSSGLFKFSVPQEKGRKISASWENSRIFVEWHQFSMPILQIRFRSFISIHQYHRDNSKPFFFSARQNILRYFSFLFLFSYLIWLFFGFYLPYQSMKSK